jgi:AcrR family transcriptional regulator
MASGSRNGMKFYLEGPDLVRVGVGKPATPRRRLPSPPRASKTRDRLAREKSLLRAATKVFSERGYEPATTREIAALAGCAEGLIHRYFNSKEGLLSALLIENGSTSGRQFREEVPESDNLEQEIHRTLAWQMGRFAKHRDYLRIAVPRALLDRTVARQLRSYCHGESVEAVAERLRSQQDKGRIGKAADPTSIARTLTALGFILGFMNPEICRFDKKEIQKMTKQIAHLLARGMQPE